jgi:hypothetical protein
VPAQANKLTLGARTRRLIVFTALLVALSLAFAGGASAQTGFQARVRSVNPRPNPCPGGNFFCGTASTNDGPATWTFLVISNSPLSNQCLSYEATSTFVLADGSTLVLDEHGSVCEPGNAFSAPGNFGHSNGNPFTATGSWTVQSATGQFASITGSGTDTLTSAGAQGSGTYTSTS